MTERIRWGLCGSGGAAASFARGLRFVEGAELVAVHSRTSEGARAFAKRFRVPRVHTSLEALAQDGEVDVVFVATSNSLHAPQTSTFLRHGRAVVCEKPFALSALEARGVVADARAAGRFCMEAMWTRFVPATSAILERVAAGDIGEPRMLVGSLGFRITAEDSPSRHDPARGGGALLDLGVYPLAWSSWIFGKPEHVRARAEISPSGIDLTGDATLTHASGATSFVEFDLDGPLANDVWIFGAEGRIHVESPLQRPEAFTIERFGGGASRKRAKGKLQRILDTPLGQRAHASYRRLTARSHGGDRVRIPARGNGYCHQLEAAMQCLRSDRVEHPLMPLDASVSLLETTDRVRAAFATTSEQREDDRSAR